MFSKIYFIVFAVFFLAESILTCYLCGWLSSIDDPRAVVSNYEYYSYLSGTFLWISTLILLVLANVHLWKTRKLWAFWTTFVYFATFIVLYTFWLDRSFIEFKREKGLLVGNYSLSPFLGVGLCIGAAFVVFFNQFVAIKMRDRMFPQEAPVNLASDEAKSSETNQENED